ncbi:MAG: hypothetical protein ACOVNL_14460 [Prochlorococcaceae cyanobacterium]|jgi:hypothetical protein
MPSSIERSTRRGPGSPSASGGQTSRNSRGASHAGTSPAGGGNRHRSEAPSWEELLGRR